MVQILPPKANIGSEFGQGLGAGVSKGLSQFADYYLKNQRANQLINEIDSPEFQKLSPAAKYATAAKLGMIEPELGRAVPAIADLIKNQAYGGALSDALFGQQEQGSQAARAGNFPTERDAAVLNMAQQEQPQNPQGMVKHHPDIEKLQGDATLYPERTATGKALPIRRQEQIYTDAISAWNKLPPGQKQLVPLDKFIDLEINAEQSNRAYNQTLNAEKQTELNFQKALSQNLSPNLYKEFPKERPPRPAEEALINKWINEAAKETNDLPEIERKVDKQVKNLVAARNRIQNLTQRPNWANQIYRGMTSGDDKSYDTALKDARSAIKPYLEMGEYDIAREEVSELGFGPVETELIVSQPDPVREEWTQSLSPYKREKSAGRKIGEFLVGPGITTALPLEADPKIVEKIGFDVADIFNRDPGVNLVLLRKDLEGKGANWLEVSQALKGLEDQGKIKLNADQQKQMSNIDKPPMNMLGKIFKNIGLGGE